MVLLEIDGLVLSEEECTLARDIIRAARAKAQEPQLLIHLGDAGQDKIFLRARDGTDSILTAVQVAEWRQDAARFKAIERARGCGVWANGCWFLCDRKHAPAVRGRTLADACDNAIAAQTPIVIPDAEPPKQDERKPGFVGRGTHIGRTDALGWTPIDEIRVCEDMSQAFATAHVVTAKEILDALELVKYVAWWERQAGTARGARGFVLGSELDLFTCTGCMPQGFPTVIEALRAGKPREEAGDGKNA